MQLTTHTDYALRTLLLLGLVRPKKLTVAEISAAYGASENHMVKVVQTLSALGYVETLRGKDGGARLAVDPSEINIGQVVREVENDLGVVACLQKAAKGNKGCTITPVCRLKGVLELATERFMETLSGYTLEHLLEGENELRRTLRLRLPIVTSGHG